MMMRVEIIDHFSDLESVRRNWDRVYAADPDANLFLSWEYMSNCLLRGEKNWAVLAAKPKSGVTEFVGFLPIRLKTREAKSGGFYSEVAMAGGDFADYTGVLLRPEYAYAAIDAFARCIKGMNWGVLRFSKMRISDDLHEHLVRHFPRSKFDVLLNYPMKDRAGVDNSICPYVVLPDNWDKYLSGLSPNTRQHLRRLMRGVSSDPDLQITHAAPESLDRTIEILIEFWSRRWREQKGSNLEAMQRKLREMLRYYFGIGILHMPVLWRGETPLGVHASLVDREKRVMHFFVGARDTNCEKPQPGLALHAHSIQRAIEMGLTRYDFLRGNERYKYSFGALERRICNTIVRARRGARLGKMLDVRSVPGAMDMMKQFQIRSDLATLEKGFRQIIDVDPEFMPAFLGFAELKAARGQFMAAEKLLRELVARHESSEAGWIALGQCLAAQCCWLEAEACFRRALALNPRLAAAHYQFGLMLEAKGEPAEARASYRKVLAIDPEYRDTKHRLIDTVLRPTQKRTRRVS
jgi:CelD/BcsL family acetyltransferase involved in cellulose biosynthesis/Tfp pilus assembly protein PilF